MLSGPAVQLGRGILEGPVPTMSRISIRDKLFPPSVASYDIRRSTIKAIAAMEAASKASMPGDRVGMGSVGPPPPGPPAPPVTVAVGGGSVGVRVGELVAAGDAVSVGLGVLVGCRITTEIVLEPLATSSGGAAWTVPLKSPRALATPTPGLTLIVQTTGP